VPEINKCLEPHPERLEVLCDNDPHPWGYHTSKDYDLTWAGLPYPTAKKSSRAKKADTINKIPAEIRTGPPTGTMLKDRGMDQVEAHAPDEVKDEAKRHLVYLAQTRAEFTSEDIIERMSCSIDEARLLGVIMAWGAREGYIAKASPDRFTTSDRPGRHAGPVRVWVSLSRTP